VADKTRPVKRRSRRHKEFSIPDHAEKVSYPAYLGDCGETVIITVTKKGRKRGKNHSVNRERDL